MGSLDGSPCRPSCCADLDQQLLQDLERLRQRQQQQAGPSGSGAASQAEQQALPRPGASPSAGGSGGEVSNGGGSPLGGLKDGLDRLLIADFFFILVALAWLGAGLAERSVLHSTVS